MAKFRVWCLCAELMLVYGFPANLLVLVVFWLVVCAVIYLLPILEWPVIDVVFVMFGSMHCDSYMLMIHW